MTKDTLRELIGYWMDAERILRHIKKRNACGGSGSDYEPALKCALDNILRLQDPPPIASEPESDAAVLTIKGHRIKNALIELELGKLSDDRARIIHWSAILTQATSELVNDYLVEEAEALSLETDHE
jgi:hypothetical protein